MPKNHHWERWSFLGQKPWNTPFGKYSFFFVLFQSSLLLSKKHSFVSRISNKRCFLAGYAQNPPFKKVAIFGQKLWTNPFGKFWFLGIFFLKLGFSCLNRILFYLGHQKTMFPGWICRKTIIEKGGHFLAKNHGIHLLKNILFFVLFQSSLLLSKKHSFVSRISNKRCFLAGYAQNPPFKKVAIFGQKLWTNPFGKFWFLGIFFFETWLFLSKQNSFLSRTSENDVSWLDLPKNLKYEK